MIGRDKLFEYRYMDDEQRAAALNKERERPEVLQLHVILQNLITAIGTVRALAAELHNLPDLSVSADILIGGVETHLATAGSDLSAAVRLLTPRRAPTTTEQHPQSGDTAEA